MSNAKHQFDEIAKEVGLAMHPTDEGANSTDTTPKSDEQTNHSPVEKASSEPTSEETSNETTTKNEFNKDLFKPEAPKKEEPKEEKVDQAAIDRERVKQATLKKALERVSSDGELDYTALKNEPNWVQKEINAMFEEDTPKAQPESQKPAELNEDYLEQWYAKRKDAETFEQKLQKVEDLNLSSSEQEELAEEFNDFVSLWMTKSRALEKALKIVWKSESTVKSEAKLPPTWGQAPAKEDNRESDINTMSDNDVIKMVQNLKNYKN